MGGMECIDTRKIVLIIDINYATPGKEAESLIF
jgi:hypothetical protein